MVFFSVSFLGYKSFERGIACGFMYAVRGDLVFGILH